MTHEAATQDPEPAGAPEPDTTPEDQPRTSQAEEPAAPPAAEEETGVQLREDREDVDEDTEEGPVHRPLIRATLPRAEGQPPPSRPGPDFTIRQPGGRASRFRPRHQLGRQPSHGNRSNGHVDRGPMRGQRRQGGRPPMMSHLAKRHGAGRKRSK